MTVLAIALILVAAVFHATWNLVAKQAEKSGGGPLFVWLIAVLASLIYAPIAFYLLLSASVNVRLGLAEIAAICVSAAIHLGYYLTLQKGYRVGDLSLVYPIARGTAPLLATVGAIVLFGERPSLMAFFGALLVSASIFLLAGDRGAKGDRASTNRAIRYGLLIAVMIATYTLWDKNAVSVLLISPILLDWGSNVIRAFMLLPYVVPRWADAKQEWFENGRRAVVVAILSPLAYILVLQAMSFTPASYVAPAREVSILVGTVMGARFLNEGGTWKRLTGACTMIIALMALTFG